MNSFIAAIFAIFGTLFIALLGFALWSQHEVTMRLASSCTSAVAAQTELLTQALPDVKDKGR